MNFQCTTRTHVGLRRKLNEDALLADSDRGLWAVADGMGGHDAGEVASAMVVESLARCADGDTFDNFVGRAIGALEQANMALVDMGEAGPTERVIGSTAVVFIAGAAHYRCFWVGDSRAYRIRGGEMVQITRDHSLVQDLVEAGLIHADDAETHPNANVVTRAVGAARQLKVDMVGGELRPADIFLLASDGLTRLARTEEMLALLATEDLEAAADALLAMALERGAPDNVSLILLRCREV